MLSNFDKIFHPELKWKDVCLTKNNPCLICEVYKPFRDTVLYGRPSEREFVQLPTACNSCPKKYQWLMDCLEKLEFYETNDFRLKGE